MRKTTGARAETTGEFTAGRIAGSSAPRSGRYSPPRARRPAMPASRHHQPDSRYAMFRLLVTLLVMTVGSSGMYVVSVMLPTVQAEFGIARADASLPYTLLMLGFGLGGVLMGKLGGRAGGMGPLLFGSAFLAAGYIATGLSGGIVSFNIAQALLGGLLGSSVAFAPLVADTSLWFVKRR